MHAKNSSHLRSLVRIVLRARARLRPLLWLLPLLILAVIVAVPLPARLLDHSQTSVRILDRNGAELYELRRATYGSQQWASLIQIPQPCIAAVLAIEDRGFYRHTGVSLKGIARALWQNLAAGRRVSGGSTISQQLARLTLGTRERTLVSKVFEALLALKLEQSLSKDEILERYLNIAYFGHRSYGLAAAARTYFGISVRELSTAQCALLAGLPQSPSSLDPFFNKDAAKSRQERVLAAMHETGALTEQEAQQAAREPLVLHEDRIDIRAPHFVLWLLTTREDALAPPAIRTTLDLTLQTEVERIVARTLKELEGKNVTSAAVVVLDAENGDILSMVGSADYFDETRDGAVNSALAARQPGSALKPFTYALALTQGDTAATTVADTAVQFLTQEGTPYTPRNYDYLEHGLVRYREALANSYNIAAVRVAQRVTVERLLSFLRSAGFPTLTNMPEHYGLALTLGDAEVRLLELAQAYGMFARGGTTLPVRALLSDPQPKGTRILDNKVAWLITDILSDPAARLAAFGEGGPLAFDFPVAAKTGTTRNSRDNWTVGFTPDRIVGVWVGNADNTPMKGTSGVTGAGPIFHDVMAAATKNLPVQQFVRPQGINKITICRLSGKLPTPFCPHVIEEWFIAGTEPTEPDDLYQPFLIDKRNGLLANNLCDQNFVEQKGLPVFPKEMEKWAREAGWPQPPTQESPLCAQPLLRPPDPLQPPKPAQWLEITRPQPNESYLLDPLIPDVQEQIIFEAHASSDIRMVDWYVNGEKAGTGKAPDFRLRWKPETGIHTVEVRSGALRTAVRLEVVK